MLKTVAVVEKVYCTIRLKMPFYVCPIYINVSLGVKRAIFRTGCTIYYYSA